MGVCNAQMGVSQSVSQGCRGAHRAAGLQGSRLGVSLECGSRASPAFVRLKGLARSTVKKIRSTAKIPSGNEFAAFNRVVSM